jgi:hypothetical protein
VTAWLLFNQKKDGENLLKYGLAKHSKETAQIDINIDPVFASSKGVFSAVRPADCKFCEALL